MSETPGGLLERLIHAGWSLRRRGLAFPPWLSADLPASPIQLLTPTPALLTFGTFCWQPGSLPSWDVYEDVPGVSSARLGEAHACYLLRIRLMRSQFYHLLAFARAHCSARRSRPYRTTTGNFQNDHSSWLILFTGVERRFPH